MSVEVYISDVCGLCYGAKNAINKTREAIKDKNNVVLYKEILHNKNAVEALESSGAITKNNLYEINKNDYVIIRAHGEPSSTFQYFKNNNISYLDCTCPNVKAIHNLVKEKNELGFQIIIVGKKDHPEVTATSGWCKSPILVENEEDIKDISLIYKKYFLVIQTTFSMDKALIIIEKISSLMEKENKYFEYRNTICNAQKNINLAASKLAKNVDAMIVIGGKNSSNSKELFNNISTITKTYFIENANQINHLIENNFVLSNQKIGITAGASTMLEDIIKVKRILESKLN